MRGKRIVTVLGTFAAAFMLTVAPASARGQDPNDRILRDDPGRFEYMRPCLSSYELIVSPTQILGTKDTTGSCAGHVWVRAMGDSLGPWHDDTDAVLLNSPNRKFRWAYIKGCSTCYAYIVYPE